MAEAIHVERLSLALPDDVPVVAAAFAAVVRNGKPLDAALTDTVRDLGFETFTYFVTTVATPKRDSRMFTWTNLPLAWVHEYEQAGLVEFDPRFMLSQKSAAPIIWDRSVVEQHPTTERFFAAAAKYGLCSGIALRLLDPNHGLSGLGLNTSRPFLTSEDKAHILDVLPRVMEFAQFLSTNIFVAIANQKLPPLTLEAPLSPRETQCLQLVARGLPSTAIAQRLGIGERTVHYHVANLIGKLGVANRHEAVARAVAARIIEP